MELLLDSQWTAATNGSEVRSPYTLSWAVSPQPQELTFDLAVTSSWVDLRDVTHHVSVVSMAITNFAPSFGLTPFNLPPIYE
jgi:hypothetical protein